MSGGAAPAAVTGKAGRDANPMERIHLCRVVGPLNARWQGRPGRPVQSQEAHLVVTKPAETCGVFVCPFEFYQEGRQHGCVKRWQSSETHHLDFNMIEHCHSLCWNG